MQVADKMAVETLQYYDDKTLDISLVAFDDKTSKFLLRELNKPYTE